jgi:hypothetical protein
MSFDLPTLLVAAEVAQGHALGHEHGQLGITFDHHAKPSGYREGGMQRTLHAATLTTWSTKRMFQTDKGKRMMPNDARVRVVLWGLYVALVLAALMWAIYMPMPAISTDSYDGAD